MRYKGMLIDQITMFNAPNLYFHLLLLLVKDCLFWLRSLALTNSLFIILAALLWLILANLSLFNTIYSFIGFAIYWLLLGVASSIGLGTGLHTFILYLGPHIAKVALTATMCGSVPEMLPSRWKFDHFGECNNHGHESIGVLGILMAVQLESFLWGLGTAIGELPPYFVAKKAAETRAELKKMTKEAEKDLHVMHEVSLMFLEGENEEESLEVQSEIKQHREMPLDEVEEMVELKHKVDLTCMEKAKLFIYLNMERYGFWAILLCASIPNPLFDLAGITSGHFQIPFKTFFSATLIGKAIIKVHIQMIFIIAIFRKETLAMLIRGLESISMGLADSFHRTFEAKKKQLNQPQSYKENKSFVVALWDLFITGMILYFLKSILDAYVKEKAITLRDC